MAARLQHLSNLRQIFLKSVESVRPQQLLSESNGLHFSRHSIVLPNNHTINTTNKKIHLVGFGKAVLGMAVQLEKALGQSLHSGLLSIPQGTLQQFAHCPEMRLAADSRIRVIEGAANNQPDEEAARAALEIKAMATAMTADDILFVLISGGGSALLPMPKAPCTLAEKTQLIRQLANRGASIDEMNVVRICLSDVKGGRLAFAGRHAYALISLVISDIVGDPVDLIASGPTCAPTPRNPNAAPAVLAKYDMWSTLPQHLRTLLRQECADSRPTDNSCIHVIGNNGVAVTTAAHEAAATGYMPCVLSTQLQGDVAALSALYKDFLLAVVAHRRAGMGAALPREHFPFDAVAFARFREALRSGEQTQKPLLLIAGGEPTVKVTGRGRGGRNQELSLRMSLHCHNCRALADVCFLSAGTDGIDGPTPAAGALGSAAVVEDFLGGAVGDRCPDGVSEFLRNNDSYNFYAQVKGGAYHVITGHTGTNVMDLHLIVVPWQ